MYVLLAGAFFLELTSLLGAIGSSWMLAFLYSTRWSLLRHTALCGERFDRLRCKAVSLRRFLSLITLGVAGAYGSRQWSGTTKPYGAVQHAALLQPRHGSSWQVDHETVPRNVSTIGVVRKSWGEEALEKHEDLKWCLGVELSEGILMWHIGTDLFLIHRRRRSRDDYKTLRAIEQISNYMMFLLVKHPYMLPGLALNKLYQVTCDDMAKVWRAHHDRKGGRSTLSSDDDDRSHDHGPLLGLFKTLLFGLHDETKRKELATALYDNRGSGITFSYKTPRLPFAVNLAHDLARKEGKREDILKVVLDVWMEILFYAANRCSGESHAKTRRSAAAPS